MQVHRHVLELVYCRNRSLFTFPGGPGRLSITPARSIARRSFRTGWSQIRSSTASISFSCGIAEKQGFAQNQIWYELVALACEPLAWTQMLALTGTARRWEPKRLRLRLFAIAARLARGAGACGCAWRRTGPGLRTSPPRSPACRPSRPADQPEQPSRRVRRRPGPVEPRPPDATAGQPATTAR